MHIFAQIEFYPSLMYPLLMCSTTKIKPDLNLYLMRSLYFILKFRPASIKPKINISL